MKDKLHKTGHKKLYYRFLSFAKGFGFSLLAIALLATPVAIAAGVNAYETTAAQQQTSQSQEAETSEVSTSVE